MQFRKFNRKQKECVLAHGLQRSKWYLIRETEFYLVIYNPESKQRLWVNKFRKLHKQRKDDIRGEEKKQKERIKKNREPTFFCE